MSKYDALVSINEIWSGELSLSDKIKNISNIFYSNGLNLFTTASFIGETPAELDALLSLGAVDDDVLKMIAEVNPPKTTWPLLANASREEAIEALSAFSKKEKNERLCVPASSFVFSQMIEISGPTAEQKLSTILGSDLFHFWEKGKSFNALTDKELRFLASVAGQRKRGKMLTVNQMKWLKDILLKLKEKKVIDHNSIDGDQDICNRVLDMLE